jgi:prepilin-type N-terminal cleavage/methylation domain-containing protein
VRSDEGFTIIEMLAVMAIIAMLAAALGVAVWKMHEQTAMRAIRAEMQSVLAAMEEYKRDYGHYPAMDVPSATRTGGLVEALYIYGTYDCSFSVSGAMYWLDPWQKEVIYGMKDDKPMFRSSGPDQEPGTNDDIIER